MKDEKGFDLEKSCADFLNQPSVFKMPDKSGCIQLVFPPNTVTPLAVANYIVAASNGRFTENMYSNAAATSMYSRADANNSLTLFQDGAALLASMGVDLPGYETVQSRVQSRIGCR